MTQKLERPTERAKAAAFEQERKIDEADRGVQKFGEEHAKEVVDGPRQARAAGRRLRRRCGRPGRARR